MFQNSIDIIIKCSDDTQQKNQGGKKQSFRLFVRENYLKTSLQYFECGSNESEFAKK